MSDTAATTDAAQHRPKRMELRLAITTSRELILLVAALGMSFAALMAWVTGQWMYPTSWTIRLAMAVSTAAIAAVPLVVCLRRLVIQQQSARRYLEVLCRLDDRDYSSDSAAVELPALAEGHAWKELLERTKEKWSESSRRLLEIEHTRAALEIRSQRSAAEQSRVATILASLNEPVLAVDQYDELVMANPSAEKLLDLHLKENGDHRCPLSELVRCEKLVELLSETHHHRSPASRTIEINLAGDQEEPHWYSATVANLPGENGSASAESSRGAVAVLRDISSQKAMQQRHAAFVSSVSHEMKTPLAGIKAYVELLADGDAEDQETRDEFLAVIQGQADRLQRLIDNMLNLARIEAGVVKVDKQSRPLNEILEEALQVVQPTAEAKSITMVADLSPLYLNVLADRDTMLQATINLLSNAVKYTPEGGKVTLRSRSADANVLFEVEDNGVGLSEEDSERVFEKFYRVKKDSQMASGTGLGLPLVKHIIEDVHNGELSVKSTLGKGSIFTAKLPAASRMN